MSIVCITMDEERKFVYDGVTFMLKVLPQDIYGRILSMGKGKRYEAMMLAVKYGVASHEEGGLVFKGDKGNVPFETEEDKQKRIVMSDKTLYIYHASGLVTALGNEVTSPGMAAKIEAAIKEAAKNAVENNGEESEEDEE